MERVRVLLADDHPLVCHGLKAMLEPASEVVGMVHHGDDVVAMAERLKAELVLLDLSLPGKSGLAVTRALHELSDRPRILIVTMHAERVYVDEAMRAGADGFILKTAPGPELRQAVTELMAGRQYISPQLPAPAWRAGAGIDAEALLPDSARELTPRQREVLLLMGRGLTTQEIAEQLEVSVKAIEYHRAGIRDALALTSHAGLMRFAALYAAHAAD